MLMEWLYYLGTWAAGLGLLSLVLWLPLSLVRSARGFTGMAIGIVSYTVGFWLWTVAASTVLQHWGVLAFFIGLFLAGIGVVPMAGLIFVLAGEWGSLGVMVLVLAVTFGLRTIGYAISRAGTPRAAIDRTATIGDGANLRRRVTSRASTSESA